jgi:hypothetical protein
MHVRPMTSRTKFESTIQRRIEPICKSLSTGQRQIEPIRKAESTSQRRIEPIRKSLSTGQRQIEPIQKAESTSQRQIEPDSGLVQTQLSSQIQARTNQKSQTLEPIFMPAGSRGDHSVPNRPWESQKR